MRLTYGDCMKGISWIKTFTLKVFLLLLFSLLSEKQEARGRRNLKIKPLGLWTEIHVGT